MSSENQLPPLGLSKPFRKRLRAFLAQSPKGLFTDIDGTLSAIAPTPEAATLLPNTTKFLVAARSLFDVVAVISGRAATDAYRMVNVPGILYIGNHGLERLDPDPVGGDGHYQLAIEPDIQAYKDIIDASIDQVGTALEPAFPGLRVEHKGVTGSIHVRNTANPSAAAAAVEAALTTIAQEHELVVTLGKMVVELRPPVKVNKGTIVSELAQTFHLQSALYMGDDTSDIDAFRALRHLTAPGGFQGVAVAILHPEGPSTLADEADFSLDSVEYVPSLLRWVVRNARKQP